MRPASGLQQRAGYLFGALPGVLLLLGSAVAWAFIQLNGLAVAGCPSRSCNYEVIFIALNGH